MFRQVFRVVGQADIALPVDAGEEAGEDPVAPPEVVSVRLAVGRDGHYLRIAAALETVQENPREILGASGQPAERDRVRRGAVVEEEGDAGAGGKPRLIGPPRVESLGRRLPDGFSALAPLESLVRREDRESDAELRQDLEGLGVHGGLRQPHPLGRPAEPVLEVPNPPEDLRALVARAGEGKDQVPVRLRERRAVPGEALAAVAVRGEDRLGDGPRLPVEPGQERRSEVEGHPRVVVGVGSVAFRGDSLVPVVEGRSRRLPLDLSRPRVLPRRLIKVAVHAGETRHQGVVSCEL